MMTKTNRTRYILISVAALVLLCAAVSLAAFAVIRALPGRYAYRLPEPLQALRRNPHPDILPTPAMVHTPALQATPTIAPAPTETPAATITPTPLPSQTPTQPPPTPTPSPTPVASYTLTGLRHERQGWNNCGPTTLAMALSFWGRAETQYDVAPVLKPDPEDKNVSPWEMEQYIRDLGLGAIVRVNGTLETLKALVRAGFPPIAETWYVRDASDQLGHYRLIVGYDDEAQIFLTYDSLHGPDVVIGYQEMDELWRVFNRAYLVIYSLDQWEALAAVIGDDVHDAQMYEGALARAQAEVASPPSTCVAYADCADWTTFSWFNVGSSLTSLGRHAEATAAYDQARQLGLHYRMLWYQFGPYESYYSVGRHEDVIALATATLKTTGNLEESYYWRGKSRQALGDGDGARADFESALRYHENWGPAQAALEALSDAP